MTALDLEASARWPSVPRQASRVTPRVPHLIGPARVPPFTGSADRSDKARRWARHDCRPTPLQLLIELRRRFRRVAGGVVGEDCRPWRRPIDGVPPSARYTYPEPSSFEHGLCRHWCRDLREGRSSRGQKSVQNQGGSSQRGHQLAMSRSKHAGDGIIC